MKGSSGDGQSKRKVVASDLATSSSWNGKVEEDESGKKVIRMSIPGQFAGHTMAIGLSSRAHAQAPTGPFRVEFVLGDEFALYLNDLIGETLSRGHSNLDLGTSMSQITDFKVSYTTKGRMVLLR